MYVQPLVGCGRQAWPSFDTNGDVGVLLEQVANVCSLRTREHVVQVRARSICTLWQIDSAPPHGRRRSWDRHLSARCRHRQRRWGPQVCSPGILSDWHHCGRDDRSGRSGGFDGAGPDGAPLHRESLERGVCQAFGWLGAYSAEADQSLMHFGPREGEPQPSSGHRLGEPRPRIGQEQQEFLVLHRASDGAAQSPEHSFYSGSRHARGEISLVHQHREVPYRSIRQANALTGLHSNIAGVVILLSSRQGRPKSRGPKILLFVPIGTGEVPIVHEAVEGICDLLSFRWSIVRQSRVRWGHRQGGSPLRVAVQLHRHLGCLEPVQHFVEGRSILFWELEAEGGLWVWASSFR
mmetsp:Transcript_79500/g.165067  ORF Transcript_79500/g.165067 Transcript_79500/m.165067 type:complete len:350 (+) Transcript_79500:415-1464(+)